MEFSWLCYTVICDSSKKKKKKHKWNVHIINNNLLLACFHNHRARENGASKQALYFYHNMEGVEEYKTWAQNDGVDWKPLQEDTWETLRIERHIMSTESLCAAAQEYSRPTRADWFQPSTVVPKEQFVIQEQAHPQTIIK